MAAPRAALPSSNLAPSGVSYRSTSSHQQRERDTKQKGYLAENAKKDILRNLHAHAPAQNLNEHSARVRVVQPSLGHRGTDEALERSQRFRAYARQLVSLQRKADISPICEVLHGDLGLRQLGKQLADALAA